MALASLRQRRLPLREGLCFARAVSRSAIEPSDAQQRCHGSITHVHTLGDRTNAAVSHVWVAFDHGSILTVDAARAVRWFDVGTARCSDETQTHAIVGDSHSGSAPLLWAVDHEGCSSITAWRDGAELDHIQLGLSSGDIGAISRDARYIVEHFFGFHEDARLWDRARRDAAKSLPNSAGIAHYAFDEDERLVLGHGKRCTISFDLDAPDERPPQTLYAREADKVLAASRSLVVYEEYLMLCVQRIRASRRDDDEIALESLSVTEIPSAVPVHSLVTIARDAERWASSGRPFEQVSIFDGMGVELAVIDLSPSAATALALSDDGAMLAVGTSSGVTHVFELPVISQ